MRWIVKGGLVVGFVGAALFFFAGGVDAATAPVAVSFTEGVATGTFERTVTLQGAGLSKVGSASLVGPSPQTTNRAALVLLAEKSTLTLRLPASVGQGDYTVNLFDKRGSFSSSATVRLTLGASSDSTTLGGQPASAFLRTTGGDVSGRLNFKDSNGITRAQVGVAPDGWPSVRLFDASGTNRIHEGFTVDGDPLVAFSDGSGVSRLRVGTAATGEALIFLQDSTGAVRMQSTVGAAGLPSLILWDGKGFSFSNIMAAMGAGQFGGSVYLYDPTTGKSLELYPQ